jgi:hypothetical protein
MGNRPNNLLDQATFNESHVAVFLVVEDREVKHEINKVPISPSQPERIDILAHQNHPQRTRTLCSI